MFSRFNKKIKLITESIFEPASKKDLAQRKLEAPKIIAQEWLEKFFERKDIHKNSDGSYDVDGHVRLSNMNLDKLPLKFNNVGGSFSCYYNKLTSLEGAPRSVGRNFVCNANDLTTLKDAPISIDGSFIASSNLLTTLEGAPTSVGGNFWCNYNEKRFTVEEVRAVSNVKGEIVV